jgi:acetylornithine deacetylase
LVSYPSESQTSNVEVTQRVASVLDRLGFQIEEIPYTDAHGVAKLSIVGKLGKGSGGLALMSHDDVVPANPDDGWSRNPYASWLAGDKLYGRGSCDMKGPLAASICAAARFAASDLKAPLYIVVTADEEIHARGAREVTERSKLFAEASLGYGVICEPTRLRVVHAHKGSLAIQVSSKGRAAHTSTLKGLNANLKMIPFLNEMKKINEQVLSARRYRNEEFKPPHSEWSIGINDHNRATNISPVQSICTINYRPMPGVDVEALIEKTRRSARKNGLRFELRHTGEPLYTPADAPLVCTALKLTGKRKPTTVSYGTDGMAFIKKMKQMIVLGPGDIAQAHTVDEWVELDQLHRGVDLYTRFIDHVCVQGQA